MQLVIWTFPKVLQANIGEKVFYVFSMKYLSLLQCCAFVKPCMTIAMHRKQRWPHIKLHLPPNFGWEVGWAPIHITLARIDLKLWKNSSQQMATYGGRNAVNAAAIIDFWEKDTNIKVFAINNHFKMLAMNWKPFCKLSCLTNHPILVPVICPVPLREIAKCLIHAL